MIAGNYKVLQSSFDIESHIPHNYEGLGEKGRFDNNYNILSNRPFKTKPFICNGGLDLYFLTSAYYSKEMIVNVKLF